MWLKLTKTLRRLLRDTSKFFCGTATYHINVNVDVEHIGWISLIQSTFTCSKSTMETLHKLTIKSAERWCQWRRFCVFISFLRRLYTLIWCFHCWLWASKSRLETRACNFRHLWWIFSWKANGMNYFWPIFSFYTPRKHQNPSGFPIFSGVIERQN